eukprot:7388478-Prymnesium_polylepis.1
MERLSATAAALVQRGLRPEDCVGELQLCQTKMTYFPGHSLLTVVDWLPDSAGRVAGSPRTWK